MIRRSMLGRIHHPNLLTSGTAKTSFNFYSESPKMPQDETHMFTEVAPAIAVASCPLEE
jgi:hypothetical protein